MPSPNGPAGILRSPASRTARLRDARRLLSAAHLLNEARAEKNELGRRLPALVGPCRAVPRSCLGSPQRRCPPRAGRSCSAELHTCPDLSLCLQLPAAAPPSLTQHRCPLLAQRHLPEAAGSGSKQPGFPAPGGARGTLLAPSALSPSPPRAQGSAPRPPFLLPHPRPAKHSAMPAHVGRHRTAWVPRPQHN